MVSTVFCANYFRFEGFEFLGYESFAVCKGLFAYVVFGNRVFERVADLDIIAENSVVANTKGFNACAFLLTSLNLGNYACAVFDDVDKFVEFGVVSPSEHSALTNDGRWLIINSGAYK